MSQLLYQCHILGVRPARPQGPGKRVLPHESAARHGVEAVRLQHVAQFDQPVVKIPVAEQRHRHSQGPVSLHLVPDIGQQQIGHPPGIHRGAENHQIPRPEGQLPLPVLRQVEAEGLILRPQILRRDLRHPGHYFFRGPGTAEIDRPHALHLHFLFLLVFLPVSLPRVRHQISPPSCLPRSAP